uniref:Uncharacterized protein n=1 Tax=Romanomermis culicivorax TaxID=13658 RepID=A0A915J5B8_ROMCU
MNAGSDTVLQHMLFSDHKQFEAQLARNLRFSLIRPDNYAGMFFTFMGYFSTMQTIGIHDQVTGEYIRILNILTTGRVLFTAKTMLSESLTGRLFYFHLNENVPLLNDHFSKNDIDAIYHYLKLTDRNLDEKTILQWIQHVENNCLYVTVKKAQLGSTSNEQWTNEGFAVDATFYRATNLFQHNNQGGATSWYALKTADLTSETEIQLFSQRSNEIYKTIFNAFMKNSLSKNYQSKFTLSKEHFLHFVHGALQYNVKSFLSIKITPIYVGPNLEKLTVLEYDQGKWITDSPPIIFEAHLSFDEPRPVQSATGINELPIDFLSNSKFALMLINPLDESLSTDLQIELTHHLMLPTSLSEFQAQLKGFAAEKHVFTPYGYDNKLIGIRIGKFEGSEDMNRFPIAEDYGDTRRDFHIILQLNPNGHNADLNQLKNFFKRQLLSSGSEKINTGLIRPISRDNSIRYEFDASFPNGKHEAHTPKGVGKIGGIVNKAIYFQMIKGIIGAAMDGDIKRMAKESGILVGMIGVGAADDMAVQWGRSILKRSSLLKGGSAYLGGKLLSKAYLGFIIADLVARSKAYEMGDKDQLVGIVGDAAILTINVIPLTVEIFSTFLSVEEASVELGPEVMIAEALIFAVIDATRSVQKIEKYLHLSWGEDIVQWTKSFFNAQTSSYLEDLSREKNLLQMAIEEAAKKLQLQNNTFTYYAAPTLTTNKNGNIVQQENNIIDMKSKTQVWSRAWPA